MTKLHFNYKDIFRAFRLGFSAKKMWVMFEGLIAGFLGYVILSYVALLIKGMPLIQIWKTYTLFVFPAPMPWYCWIVWWIGFLWFVFMLLLSGVTVSKLTYEQLRGDEFFEVKEAWKLAWQRAGSLVASPILLAVFIAILLIAGLVLSLIGKIPYFGELFVGIMAIPAFAVSLFIIYLLIVLLFTFTLAPSVIGVTKSDAFDTLFEVFSCVNDQPWRLVLWQGAMKLFSFIGIIVLGFFSVKAVSLGSTVVRVFMGLKLDEILNNSLSLFKFTLPSYIPFTLHNYISRGFEIIGASILFSPPSFSALGWAKDIAAVLLGITIYVIFFFILSYGTSIWFAGNTVIYLVLVKKKDDRNLLEVKEEEFEIPEKVEAKEEEKKEEKKTRKKVTKRKVKRKKK